MDELSHRHYPEDDAPPPEGAGSSAAAASCNSWVTSSRAPLALACAAWTLPEVLSARFLSLASSGSHSPSPNALRSTLDPASRMTACLVVMVPVGGPWGAS